MVMRFACNESPSGFLCVRWPWVVSLVKNRKCLLRDGVCLVFGGFVAFFRHQVLTTLWLGKETRVKKCPV